MNEDTRITILATLSLWAAAVVSAAFSGVFTKLSVEEQVALAVFASALSLATYALDPAVRAYVRARNAIAAKALVLDALVAADVAFMVKAGGWDALGALPHATTLYFVLPLALVASLAALQGLNASKVRSMRAKSPGATPAAT